jgi:glycosyltransferase 2 family protein
LNWSEVRLALSHANPYLLALALVIICSSYLVRAARWGALLAPLSPAKMHNLFIATTVGFGALFLFGRMGEVVRPLVLPMRDRNIRPSASFVTIMVERIYDTLAVVILFAANLIWMQPPASGTTEFNRVRVVGVLMLIGVLFGVFLMTLFRKNADATIGWLSGKLDAISFIPPRLTRAIISILEQLAKALRVLVNARELAVTMGWTIILWSGVALGNWLVLRAFGLHFGITQTIFVLGWALVGSLVPTPGGAAGAFHAATAGALIFLGIERDTAAAISIVLHLIDFGPALLVGLVFIARGDVKIKNLRSITSTDTVEHAIEDDELPLDVEYQEPELKALTARD